MKQSESMPEAAKPIGRVVLRAELQNGLTFTLSTNDGQEAPSSGQEDARNIVARQSMPSGRVDSIMMFDDLLVQQALRYGLPLAIGGARLEIMSKLFDVISADDVRFADCLADASRSLEKSIRDSLVAEALPEPRALDGEAAAGLEGLGGNASGNGRRPEMQGEMVFAIPASGLSPHPAPVASKLRSTTRSISDGNGTAGRRRPGASAGLMISKGDRGGRSTSDFEVYLRRLGNVGAVNEVSRAVPLMMVMAQGREYVHRREAVFKELCYFWHQFDIVSVTQRLGFHINNTNGIVLSKIYGFPALFAVYAALWWGYQAETDKRKQGRTDRFGQLMREQVVHADGRSPSQWDMKFSERLVGGMKEGLKTRGRIDGRLKGIKETFFIQLLYALDCYLERRALPRNWHVRLREMSLGEVLKEQTSHPLYPF